MCSRIGFVRDAINCICETLDDAPSHVSKLNPLRIKVMKMTDCTIREYEMAIADLRLAGMVRFTMDGIQKIA